MRVLLQRVNKASVTVGEQIVGAIDRGLLLLVGFGNGDSGEKLAPMADKIVHARVFPDERGRFDKSVLDIDGGILLVPQFTLYGDMRKGRRPDFGLAMEPATARQLFAGFVKAVSNLGVSKIGQGTFGAHMLVALENDGPVTLMFET